MLEFLIRKKSAIITPNIGPKNDPTVSTNDNIPILLNNGNQRSPTKKDKNSIVYPELLRDRFLGKKLISEF